MRGYAAGLLFLFGGCGVMTMAGQVLEISKHENTVTTAAQGRPGGRARIYRFPDRTPLLGSELPAVTADQRSLRRLFHLHLAAEVGIGLTVWLVWFLWHLLH